MTSDYASPSNLVPRLPIKYRFFLAGGLGSIQIGSFRKFFPWDVSGLWSTQTFWTEK